MTSPQLKPVESPSLMFTDWQTVGEHTFTPDDSLVVVGSFSMGEGDDTIWVRMTQLNGQVNSPWSYGILSWRTTAGYELGSVKAYGQTQSEVFRLGTGRPPSLLSGSITFEPRGFNLGWIKSGNPWSLQFEASSGVTNNSGGGPLGGAVSNGFVNTANNGLQLVQVSFPPDN